MNLFFNHRIVNSAVFLLLQAGLLFGQAGSVEDRLLISDPQDLLELKQEDHLRTVSSDLQSKDVREAPANIQVITARQIEASGARDLYEVLQMVPGISMGMDPQEGIGMGAHGTWAYEAKFLFLLNGNRLNDNDHGGYALGNRIPIDNIERIEVILGPGPLTHDSQALLGSINIITRTADQGSGGRASIRSGHSNGDITQNSGAISGSQRLSGDQEISYLAGVTYGSRSNYSGSILNSEELSFGDSTGVKASTFQFQYRWKNLKAFMVYMDESQSMSTGSHGIQRRDMIVGVRQRLMLRRGLEFTWRITHTDQLPGNQINTLDPERLARNTSHQRIMGSTLVSYKPTAWSAIRFGMQAYHQRSEFLIGNESTRFRMNGDRNIGVNMVSAFLEMNATSKFGSLTGGYKAEHNDLLGNAFAPRIAYNHVIGRLHGKAILTQAYAMPSIMTMHYGPDQHPIDPEYATTIEGELGIRICASSLFTFNGYQTWIENPVQRYLSDDHQLHYMHSSGSGTEGIDLRITSAINKFTGFGGIGLYRPMALNSSTEAMAGPGPQGEILLPAQRATMMLAWDATRTFSLRTRGSWRSGIRMYQGSIDDPILLVEWPSELLINAGVIIRPQASERISIDLGCNNILDTDRPLPAHSFSTRPPFMLNGREFTFALHYRFVQ